MKRQQKPTEAQAEIIRRAGLDPETVTVTSKSAALPLAIIYHGDGLTLPSWIALERGRLILTDTKPGPAKSKADTAQDETEVEAAEREAAATPPEPRRKALERLAAMRSRKQSRAEIEASWRRHGLTAQQAAIVYAREKLGQTLREIARETGKSRGTIANELRRAKAALQREPLPAHAVARAYTDRPLNVILTEMRAAFVETGHQPLVDPELAAKWREPGETQADRIVATIKHWPNLLLDPKHGPGLVAALVDLLEAARLGKTGKRAPALRLTGKRDVVRAAAQRSLAYLTYTPPGRRYAYPDGYLAAWLLQVQHALAEIQRAYRETMGEPITLRLQKIREAYGSELPPKITDKALQPLLTRNLLEKSADLAAKATELHAEVFRRAWRNTPRFHQFLKARIGS